MNSLWGAAYLLTQNYHLVRMNVVSADSAYLLEMRSQDLNIKEHF